MFIMFNRPIGAGNIRNTQDSKLAYCYSIDKGVNWSSPKVLNLGGTGGAVIRIVAPFNDSVNINNLVFGVDWREVGPSTPHVSLLHIDITKSYLGKHSYPASLVYSSDSIGISYTDRIYIGRNPGNIPILRGSIKYINLILSVRNDMTPFINAEDNISIGVLVNKVSPKQNNQVLPLADDAWAKIFDSSFVSIDTIRVNNFAYIHNAIVRDDTENVLHILSKGVDTLGMISS